MSRITSVDYNTVCTKKVWIVVFAEKSELRSQRVAALDFTEVLTYFNVDAHSKIVKVEQTDEDITYRY